jgi:hypothetical protein
MAYQQQQQLVSDATAVHLIEGLESHPSPRSIVRSSCGLAHPHFFIGMSLSLFMTLVCVVKDSLPVKHHE